MEKLVYTYGFLDGRVELTLNRELFTEDLAKSVLEAHLESETFNKSEDVVLNACKKIAYHAFWVASTQNYNTHGVKTKFEDSTLCEGYPCLDGSAGITLEYVEGFEFDPFDFNLEEVEE